ncbi:amine oxidase [Auriscalpium vulgare]|uniref:Amine oxidase n=1 Tax=Auriscalpium vulgare TaxID=40419 RepID=A0ACB8S0T6_9AGAM|nr:amine oxidase [Auriscalpium vulgare]
MRCPSLLLSLAVFRALSPCALAASTLQANQTRVQHDAQVLILGGGVSGVIAARSLHEQGIHDFKIVEARDELGGRMRSFHFGAPGKQVVLELGANWIQGTQDGNGPANPILTLARKHGLKTVDSDLLGSMSTFDFTGTVDYLDVLNSAIDAFDNITNAAGARMPSAQVDTTARTGYSLVGVKPKTPAQKTCEYYLFDWEYAQTPEQSSWIASAWNTNFTYDTDVGGFSEDNLFAIDSRGFKHLIHAEADTFIVPGQILLNSTVRSIKHSNDGVEVTLVNGTTLNADYVICTFSLGVLQNDDVVFEPSLPGWKLEAVQSMVMATYTKIFLQFPEKFWFDTQFALYADKERGRYPVWQGLDIEGFFPGSGVLFVTVTGDYSVRIEALSDDQVQAEVLSVLHAMYPNITFPAPIAFHFPRWHSDPLYRGTYSNWPASFVEGHLTNLRANVGQRLWFTGEAMSEKYYGFLHGAYFEGEATGNTVAQCIRGAECAGLPHSQSIRNAQPYMLQP